MSSDDEEEEFTLPSKAKLQQLKQQRSDVGASSTSAEIYAAMQADAALAKLKRESAANTHNGGGGGGSDAIISTGTVSLPDDSDPTDDAAVQKEIAAWKERHAKRLQMML